MENDERIEIEQEARGILWEKRLNESYKSGRLCTWVSSFHHLHLPCQLANKEPYHGAYNAGLKFTFDDGATWLLRFPRVGKVHDSCMDEKVAMEVAVVNLIREKSTIPVPNIHAWGIGAENTLGLGPFIIMEFIQNGVSLNDLLKDTNNGTRLLRDDLSDREIETIYRQFANILVQLFKLDFDHIGNLDSPSVDLRFPSRPLTWKIHDILQTGGVDTFGSKSKSFSSTTEYFQYVINQDWEQLVRQQNSAYGPYDAKDKYRSLKGLISLLPNFTHHEYDNTKFKIICDDLGLANLIVRSRDDLTIIGVVDLEWSYIGPGQLFTSGLWWLLMDRPTNQQWDSNKEESIGIGDRYFRYLEIFKRVLEEEESRIVGCKDTELSSLVHWSEQSGAMWLHMLLTSGFNHPLSFPFNKLILHVGTSEWERRKKEVSDPEVEAFGTQKRLELEQYEKELERMQTGLIELANPTALRLL